MAAKKKGSKTAVKAKAKARAKTPKRPAAKRVAKRAPAKKVITKKVSAKKVSAKKVSAKAKVSAKKTTAKTKSVKSSAAKKPAAKRPAGFVVATIVQEELFDAAPMDVYEAIIDPSKHAAFTGSVATGEPIEGGSFTAWDGYIEGRHERLVPGARIVQVWRTSDFPEEHPHSRLELELRPEPEGKTRLRMTHSGVPKAQAKGYEQGWVEHYWKPLREYLRDTQWPNA